MSRFLKIAKFPLF